MRTSNSVKLILRKVFKKILDIIFNPYVLLILSAILIITVQSIIIAVGIAIFVFVFFAGILFFCKNAKKKRTYLICFILSTSVFVVTLFFSINKIPALVYNFGHPMSITNADDVKQCLDKGIKNTIISPLEIEGTPYLVKETVALRGQYPSSDSGRTRFYYSVVKLNGVKLLLKHSKENISDKSLNVYFTELESHDLNVHSKMRNLGVNLYEAVAIYDEETFNSDLLLWRILTIEQFVILLISAFASIYVAYKYNQKYFLFKQLSFNISNKQRKISNKFDKDKTLFTKQLDALSDFAIHNEVLIKNVLFDEVDITDRNSYIDNLNYCNNKELEKFKISIINKINTANNRQNLKNISITITKEFEKISNWNSMLKKYI